MFRKLVKRKIESVFLKIKKNKTIKKIYVNYFNGQIRICTNEKESLVTETILSKGAKRRKLLREKKNEPEDINISIVNEIKESKNPLVYINGNKVNYFDVPSNIKEYIFANEIKTVFQYSVFMETFSQDDKRWASSSWVTYLSYTEREDDDLMYGTCQDLCKRLLMDVTLDNESLNEDFQIMKETISLQVSDFYVSVLRSAVMLLEDCKKNKYDNVIICMANMNFAVVLSNILELNGFKSTVVKLSHVPIKKFNAISTLYSEKAINRMITIRKKNIDLENSLNGLKERINKDKKFILSPFRGNDNFYFQLVTLTAQYMPDYEFFALDRFINENVENKLKDPTLSDNFNFICLTPYVAFLEDEEADLLVKNLIQGIEKKLEDNLKYQEFNIGSFFIKYALNQFGIQTMTSLYYYRLFDRLFKERRPHAILASPSRPVEARAAILAGRKHGITSFDLQGGTLFKTRRFWKTEADYLLCSDALSKTIYHEFYSLEEERVLLVGSPRLDHNVAKYKKLTKIKDHSKKRIFLALQPLSSDNNLKMVNVCLEAIKDMKDTELTVGFHPRDNDANKKNVINNAQGKFNLVKRDSSEELMEHDICITYYSFMGVEAFAMGCKLISLNVLEHKKWPYRLRDLGIAKEAYNARELKELILDDREYDLDESAIVLRDGLSLQRISELINNAAAN
jgi:hypothetical protein